MLITNPVSTHTNEADRRAVHNALSVHHEVHQVPTTHRGHAEELGASAVADGYGAVVVYGGDGSVNEVVNGLLGTPDSGRRPDAGALPVLGIVPAGNANVFARSLGIDRHAGRAIGQLTTALDAGVRRTVGLGHTLGRWFLFNAGMGIDATVVRHVHEHRQRGRKVTNLLYLRGILEAFLRPAGPAPTITVEIPGRSPVTGARFGFVSNSSPWTYLGVLPIRTNPGTDIDRGLGLAAATSLSPWRNLLLGARLLAGSADPRAAHFIRDDDIEQLRFTAGEPADVQIDGDYMGRHRQLDFGCAHRVLPVAAPRQAGGVPR